ncbi:MAG TPA: serine/threonine-protein kinase [Longimicrobiales bacterium]|nr:serine/threonine-protein kinase [Longimicrobiales bacterium]
MSREHLWERWGEVDHLLERVLDMPEDARESFLDDACRGDAALRDLVLGLVRDAETPAEATGAVSGLLRAALREPVGTGSELPEALEGKTLGPYRLERIIGRGGMASVYLAERVDGLFQRQVAVKVLEERSAPEMARLGERFRLERRILATLDHEGIARLIDGGVSGDGRAFLVMEYVDGTSIERYAQDKRLGPRERIALIAQAAQAVEHAHRNMVVHRDLKPSNILVSRDGAVKLLDFGIAKLLEDPEQEGGGAVTRTATRFATPAYAAPELLLGEAVTAQTDVYGLAAVLYELLTGVRPWASRGDQSVLERVVQGEEPTAPSAAAAGNPAAADWGVTGPILSGDLDAILLRGLRARPGDRYPSVAAFRDDLERYLAGRAVLARADDRLYRARRFLGRYRWPLGAAAGAFLVVAGSAAGLAVQRGALLEERSRAEAAAEDALREAATARRVTDFLVGLFEAADPTRDRADTLTAAGLVERGSQRIERELAGEPEVRSELLVTLGRVQANLGDYDRADTLLVRAVALREDSVPERRGLAEALAWLGGTRRVAGDHDGALAAYRRALDEAEGREPGTAADARLGMASTWMAIEALDSAEVAYDEAMRLMARAGDTASASYQGALGTLAGLVRRRGDLEGAAGLYEHVIALQRGEDDGDPMSLAVSLNNLAVTRRMQGRFEDAALLYGEAVDTASSVLGPGHPTSLLLMGNLARAWEEMGDTERALETYRARVVAARTQWPEGHWRVADVEMNHGAMLLQSGRPAEAASVLASAVQGAADQLGPNHTWTAVYRGWLGAAAVLAGDVEMGRDSFRRSLVTLTLATTPTVGEDRQVQSMLDALLLRLEDPALAEYAAAYRDLLAEARGGESGAPVGAPSG